MALALAHVLPPEPFHPSAPLPHPFLGILNGHLCHTHRLTCVHTHTLMTFSWPLHPTDECKKCGQIMGPIREEKDEGSWLLDPAPFSPSSLLTKWFVNILRIISWHCWEDMACIFPFPLAFNRLKSCMHQASPLGTVKKCGKCIHNCYLSLVWCILTQVLT